MAGPVKIQALIGAGVIALGALAFAPSGAFAQSDDENGPSRMTLSGGIQLPAAFDPINVAVPELIAAPASHSGAARSAAPAEDAEFLDSEGSASAMPWYQRFTVAPTEPQILWSDAESFEVQAGERWGVTLGYRQGQRSAQTFDLEDFRAGAFFELTERVRLGGQLRFTSPEEEIFGEETEDRAPEVRFESAFKF